MPEQSPHRRPQLPTRDDFPVLREGRALAERRTWGRRGPARGPAEPGDGDCPERRRDGDEAACGLSDLLAGQVEMARSCFGIDRLAILNIERDSGELVLSASSPPLAARDDVTTRFSLRLDQLGPLSKCAVHAEEETVSTSADTARPREGALLRLLGDSVHILPLVARQGLRCWRELDCRRPDCPAHGSPESRCWLVPHAVCRDGIERGPRESLVRCLACPAFNVQGVMAIGLGSRAGASGVDTSRKFRRFVASIAAVMEADQSAKALLRLNRDLERRVDEVVKEREIARTRAAESEKLAATGKLVAGLAHQINNPLAVISMCAQSLRMGGNDATATARNVEIIATEVRRLSRLVSNLLDFARDRDLDLAEVDLGEFVEQVVNLARPTALRSGVAVSINTTGNRRVCVDRVLMQQVFVNVIANAIQAAPREGWVEVSVRDGAAEEGAGPAAEVIVKDNGPGMAPDVLASAFDPFFTTKAQSGGIGLGLSLASLIAERHGGAISVESASGKGSTFTVRLPLCDHRDCAGGGGATAGSVHPSRNASQDPAGRRDGDA
ncbi:MAG: sensor histidine kinase [Planctomycetota bacterium]